MDPRLMKKQNIYFADQLKVIIRMLRVDTVFNDHMAQN